LEASQTTPDPRLLARILREAKDAGVDNVVMEVSSHALDQDRAAGVDFDIAVFTNLSQDHLDYHEDIERYFEAKLRLFRMLDEPSDKTAKAAVVNADDPRCDAVAAATSKKVVRYGTGPTANIKASGIKVSLKGTSFKVTGIGAEFSVRLQLVGQHNVMNALAATAVAAECGVGVDAIKGGIEKLETVPGRFEMIDCGQPFSVVVDYAHTEDGLRNLLLAARSVTTGRVIAVFGCGGDRDRTKRPKMAQVVARMSDFAVLTSDNPRTEDPVKIVLDAEVGLQHEGKAKGPDYIVELDRRQAIGKAVSVAQPGDILVIAGKGHETYQIIGETRVPFDDREVARETLRACL
jgi:UDP-N-acetylmuramyl-tripeptide synthetase